MVGFERSLEINSELIGQETRSMSLTGDDDEIVAVHAAEDDPGALVEEIAIDLVAAQECDTPLPIVALGLRRVELLGEIVGLDLQAPLCLEAAPAVVRVMHEIRDRAARDRIER